jgi:tripartite-type tricarboxylate transporter receptor subunit TctC
MLSSWNARRARPCAGFAVAAGAILALAAGAPAQSQANWPTKTVRVIVPFAPGSATDLLPRALFEHVSTKVGQSFIIENRPGGGGAMGVSAVAKADPDGHTVLVHSNALVTAPAIQAMPYDPVQDFAGITPLGNVPLVLVISPDKKITTLKDLVAAAKARPGAMNYASVGPGSASHLNAERFLMASGIKAQHVPFKGGPEALTEIMAGRIDFYFVPLSPARGLLDAGKLAVLAVSGSQRAAALPDVPTTVEAGFPNSDYNFWVGMFAPAATPKEIIGKLNSETIKALQVPAVRAKLEANAGGEPMPMTSAEFDAFVRKEIDVNAALVKAAGIEVN